MSISHRLKGVGLVTQQGSEAPSSSEGGTAGRSALMSSASWTASASMKRAPRLCGGGALRVAQRLQTKLKVSGSAASTRLA